MNSDKRLYTMWDEETFNSYAGRFLAEKDSREWLELVRFAMDSGVTKEEFKAFLESEAQKRGKTIKPPQF